MCVFMFVSFNGLSYAEKECCECALAKFILDEGCTLTLIDNNCDGKYDFGYLFTPEEGTHRLNKKQIQNKMRNMDFQEVIPNNPCDEKLRFYIPDTCETNTLFESTGKT